MSAPSISPIVIGQFAYQRRGEAQAGSHPALDGDPPRHRVEDPSRNAVGTGNVSSAALTRTCVAHDLLLFVKETPGRFPHDARDWRLALSRIWILNGAVLSRRGF